MGNARAPLLRDERQRGAGDEPGLTLGSARGRWVVAATILGSGMASLDATVVGIALPRIGEDLGVGLTGLQWTVNAYVLTLAAFLLLGGSLGDRLGRRRVFLIGVVWFAAASTICAVAPSAGLLIVARALQGVGGALLTPGSLAILEASFRKQDRAAAIGAWSGFAGIAVAIGPFVGGWLIESVSWRLIFLVNLPVAVAVAWVTLRYVPESRDPAAPAHSDFAGTALAAAGLAGVVYALTDGPDAGWTSLRVLAAGLLGAAALVGFIVVEARSDHAILPLRLFRSAQFSAANAVTFVVYGALGGTLFLLPIQLQRVLGYSPTAAGASLLPITVVMLLLSSRMGRLATRIGPRLPMTFGPLVCAVGALMLSQVGAGSGYFTGLIPGVTVFGLGLATTVAPLTATVLAAAGAEHAGVASAVNTDVARTAQLIAVAVLPLAAGITAATYADVAAFSTGFQHALWISAAVLAAGGGLAFATIRRPLVAVRQAHMSSCAVDAPPRGPAAVGGRTAEEASQKAA
jgi:EmrB/QacA subfamily drug resistance transporter